LNNLYAACVTCNTSKGVKCSRSARNGFGNTRAPYSAQKKARIRSERTGAGTAIGLLAGGILGGPVGALLGGSLGALIGNETSPKK
jgi:hypothetical protein